MESHNKAYIFGLVAENRIWEALDILNHNIPVDSELFSEFINYKRRFESLSKEKNLNTISEEQYELGVNRLVSSLTSLISRLSNPLIPEFEDSSNNLDVAINHDNLANLIIKLNASFDEKIQKINSNKNRYIITIIILTILVTFLGYNLIKKINEIRVKSDERESMIADLQEQKANSDLSLFKVNEDLPDSLKVDFEELKFASNIIGEKIYSLQDSIKVVLSYLNRYNSGISELEERVEELSITKINLEHQASMLQAQVEAGNTDEHLREMLNQLKNEKDDYEKRLASLENKLEKAIGMVDELSINISNILANDECFKGLGTKRKCSNVFREIQRLNYKIDAFLQEI